MSLTDLPTDRTDTPDATCTKLRRHWVAWVLLPAVLDLVLCTACNQAMEHTADAVDERDSVPMMTSYGVNTLISDSGVIKYRIVTERWEVNTAKQPSRWEFMKGVFFEQFDEQFHVQAYIQADTAWYFDQLRLWKLRGRVCVRNTNGMVYTGEELYWDGMRREFYSNVFSRVVTPERTLQGTCFRSDEGMNHYTVSNSKGSFVKDDVEGDADAQPADTLANDTTPEPKRAPAAKHSTGHAPAVRRMPQMPQQQTSTP